jgi:hypothetical protein
METISRKLSWHDRQIVSSEQNPTSDANAIKAHKTVARLGLHDGFNRNSMQNIQVPAVNLALLLVVIPCLFFTFFGVSTFSGKGSGSGSFFHSETLCLQFPPLLQANQGTSASTSRG